MSLSIKSIAAIALAALLVFPATLNAQKKMPKKYKNAPDQTIVIVTNSPAQAFDEAECSFLILVDYLAVLSLGKVDSVYK